MKPFKQIKIIDTIVITEYMSAYMRKDMISYIEDNIGNASDKDITELYNKMSEIVTTKITDNVLNRVNQTIYIESNLKYMNTDNLYYIKNVIVNSLSSEESKDDKMKKITLEIINKLLIEMKRKPIIDLCDFTDVYRDEIIKDKYKNIIDENLEYILENGFTKQACMLRQKKVTKHYHLSVLKGMLKSIGYVLQPKIKNKSVDNERKILTFYSVEKL